MTAIENILEVENAASSVAEQPTFDLLEGTEDEQRRELHAKHYKLGGGKRQAVLFGEPVHYAGDDGALHEIDNTLQPVTVNGVAAYRNTANPLQITLPATANDEALVRLSHEGHELSWGFEQPVRGAAAEVSNGEALVRRELLGRAAAVKQGLAAMAEASGLHGGSAMSTAALAEAVAPAGLDKTALAEVMTAEDPSDLSTAVLDKALRTPADRRMSRLEKQAELSYSNLLPGISARYTLTDAGVKEDIVVAEPDALDQVALKLPSNYRYTVAEDQSVSVAAGEEILYTFAPPRVYDAAGQEEIAGVELESCSGYTRMRYVLPEAFLSNAVYPITIDPVVRTGYKDKSAVTDVYISTHNKTSSGNNTFLQCGFANSYEYITLIRFNRLIQQSASDTIISAYLRVTSEHIDGDTMYFGCYPIVTPWSASTVSWNSMNPHGANSGIGKKMLAYITNIHDNTRYFDITNLCRGWYRKDVEGNTRNFGVALRVPDGFGSGNFTYWKATTGNTTGNPRLIVNYVSHAGVESWWQYETMSAGRAGTAHVDIYNGNLVFDHPDVAMSGNLMPVSVTHYYNSCLSAHNDWYCGYGWRTSMHQSLHKETLNSTIYYVWTDGDGTEHYFEQTGSAPYKDCEGMELKLTISGSTATITDKEHTRMLFPLPSNATPQYITNIQDAHYTGTTGSQITLTYVAGKNGMIDTVTDGAGRVTRYVYENDLLKGIVAPDGIIVAYKYDSESRLVNVQYSDLNNTIAYSAGTGTITYSENSDTPCTTYTYEQDSNILIAARNYDGVTVNIGFETEASYDTACIDNFAAQARKVISLDTENTADVDHPMYGARQQFEYLTMTTKVTSMKAAGSDAGKTITYQFNDAGNVTCMYDELGYAQATTYASSLPNTADKTSRLQKTVINFAPNLDFSTGWTAQLAGEGDSVVRDPDVRCLNMYSARMVKAMPGETVYSIAVPAHRAGKHTFSVYIKTDRITGGGAYARLVVGDDSYESRKVNTSTANVSGGPNAEGWERVFVSAEMEAEDAVQLELVCDGEGGTAWFSCPQLEVGSIPNPVNLLVNGDFRNTYTTTESTPRVFPVSWTKLDGVSSSAENGIISEGHGMPEGLGGNALRMISRPDWSSVAFQQSVNIRGGQGDTYVIGGWVNAESVAKIPTETGRKNAPCIAYRFVNNGTAEGWQYVEFSREWVGWQFGCWPITASGAYTHIEYTINYARNAQAAMFSNMFLYREQFGESFTYDSNKNVTSVANLANTKSNMTYDSADNLTSYVQPGANANDKYTFNYGSAPAKHLLQSSKTPMGIEQKFEYDDKGNQTQASTEGTIGGATAAIKARTVYTAEGSEAPLPAGVNQNYVHRSYDARGKAVTKNINAQTYVLDSVEDPTGQTVAYEYDAAHRVTQVKSEILDGNNNVQKRYKNTYTYEKDRIRTVSHNTTSNDDCDVTYTFDYDALGRKTDVRVGNREHTAQENPNDFRLLSHNEYTPDRSGLLQEVQYGNGGTVEYEYDDYDRMTGVKYDGETDPRYTYEYGANGEVAYMEDSHLGQSKQVEYDLAERPCQATIRELDTGDLQYRTTLKYDGMNRLERFGEQTVDGSHRTEYTYDKDNRTTAIQYDDASHKTEYEYDTLGRITSRKATNGGAEYDTQYGYVAGAASYGEGATTPLVASITQGSGGNAMNYGYTYDDRGNIIAEDRGNGRVVSYEYDEIGQLIRVNDPEDQTAGSTGTTWAYAYDCGGNILSKKRYVYTTGTLPATAQATVSYGYGDPYWKDLLTSYDGHTITYDDIGNMLSDGERTYEWQAGRQLKKVTMVASEADCQACVPGTDGESKVVIEFSGTNVLENNAASVTASAKVYNEGVEVTNSIPASHFSWTRESGNATADAAWNSAHTGMKQVTVARSELTADIVISCTVQAVDFYGTVQVDDTLMASHTPSSSDANDTFSIVDGDLIVNTSKAAGCYMVDEGVVKANNVILIHDLTASAVVYTARPSKMVEFKYNADGLRTRKEMTLGNKVVTTDYTLHGKLVTHMKVRTELNGAEVDAQQMHFFYDAQSRPAMVEWNGRKYTYVHNLQGDIVAILDSEGAKVVEYRYDAWGRDIGRTLTSEIGELNPFRYRGYVYDEETGLYYLRSRYYDARIGRFVSIDTHLCTGQAAVGNNIFCYGNNNYIVAIDNDGNEPEIIEFNEMSGILVFLKRPLDDMAVDLAGEDSILFTGHIATISDGLMISYGPDSKTGEKQWASIRIFNSIYEIYSYMRSDKQNPYIECYYMEIEWPSASHFKNAYDFVKTLFGEKANNGGHRINENNKKFIEYNTEKSACVDVNNAIWEAAGVVIDSLLAFPSRFPRLMVLWNKTCFKRVHIVSSNKVRLDRIP